MRSDDMLEELRMVSRNLELETEETADEADAKVILDKKVYSADADVESPNREIREMLKNHDEPLEEWKD